MWLKIFIGSVIILLFFVVFALNNTSQLLIENLKPDTLQLSSAGGLTAASAAKAKVVNLLLACAVGLVVVVATPLGPWLVRACEVLRVVVDEKHDELFFGYESEYDPEPETEVPAKRPRKLREMSSETLARVGVSRQQESPELSKNMAVGSGLPHSNWEESFLIAAREGDKEAVEFIYKKLRPAKAKTDPTPEPEAESNGKA